MRFSELALIIISTFSKNAAVCLVWYLNGNKSAKKNILKTLNGLYFNFCQFAFSMEQIQPNPT